MKVKEEIKVKYCVGKRPVTGEKKEAHNIKRPTTDDHVRAAYDILVSNFLKNEKKVTKKILLNDIGLAIDHLSKVLEVEHAEI